MYIPKHRVQITCTSLTSVLGGQAAFSNSPREVLVVGISFSVVEGGRWVQYDSLSRSERVNGERRSRNVATASMKAACR